MVKEKIKKTHITVSHYPETFTFITRSELPPFKSYCKVRKKVLMYWMTKEKIHSPFHDYDNYEVEGVDISEGEEEWHLST